MRTLSGVLFAATSTLALGACEDDPSPAMVTAPNARSQGVQAAATTATTTATATATAASTPAPVKERPVLCAQQLGKPAKDVPEAPLGRAGNKGLLPEKLPVGPGWTWINLWAAWCVPCKQEMPILRAWEKQLSGERTPLRVAFVSLDDDPRQLDTFLGAEPPSGMKATYWLEDGPRRAAWLKEAGFDGEPELPAHLLVDPSGKVRCRVQGAIEGADYVELVKILRGERGGGGAGAGAARAKEGAERGDRKGRRPE
jgi:thiol-disulfide isomerase/thioredoxin